MIKQRLTISLGKDVLEVLEKQANEIGLSKSAFITTLILSNAKKEKGA